MMILRHESGHDAHQHFLMEHPAKWVTEQRRNVSPLHAEFSRFADPGNKLLPDRFEGLSCCEKLQEGVDNELNPSSKCFQKIVDERRISVLRNIGYAY